MSSTTTLLEDSNEAVQTATKNVRRAAEESVVRTKDKIAEIQTTGDVKVTEAGFCAFKAEKAAKEHLPPHKTDVSLRTELERCRGTVELCEGRPVCVLGCEDRCFRRVSWGR